MKVYKLDRTGHTTFDSETTANIQAEIETLMKQGYALFLKDEKIKDIRNVPADAEILALAPLVGG